MRNQWRLLLLQRCKPVSDLQYKVHSSPLLPLSRNQPIISQIIPHSRTPTTHFQNPNFTRFFSSSVQSNITPTLIELYSDPYKSNEDVMLELESKTNDNNIIELFKNRGSDPEAGRVFYEWVMGKESGDFTDLRSNSCNQLLGILGANGLVVYSGDLVKSVLENLGTDLNKAVIFFRWVEESGLWKHDEKTYNAIAREVAREECLDKFWRLIDEMRAAGFDLEKGTYVRVLNQFVRKRMLKDAVELYAFAMGGNVKPSVQDCPFLLKKIATGEKLDMDLFSKVLTVYKEGENTLTNAALDSVLKSLTSVGRFNECNKILRAMEEVGFFPDENLQSKIGFQLSNNSETEEASKFLDFVEGSRTIPSYKTFGSLIEGYCLSGHLDKACDCFEKLIENGGSSYAGYALETLTNAYCSKERANEAYKLLANAVTEKEVKPWHTTYKLLISKLLDQGLFKEATDLFAPMKAHGYPPYLDPFVKYVSKTGTTDETVMFLKAMTYKKVPSTAVYLRVFKAYFKAGRHNQAQDFLSKCPRYIRNHVDVLTLFSSMKLAKGTAAPTPVAA
ncbi:putative pentatricopeptide repeat-containing protein BIR6 [Helianthus annuus]|nr:putative pentatricopeptide repeat-containing protein BIR6 [Helianthus annuus]